MTSRLLTAAASLLTATALWAQATVPYSESFDSAEAFDAFTTITNTTRSWTYYAGKQCAQFWGGSAPVEAWLISPEIALRGGQTYRLTFRAGLENAVSTSSYKHLSVTIGQGVTAQAQDATLWSETLQSALMTVKTAYFTVPADGNYNLGFCVDGETNAYAVFVDDIAIVESQVTPQPATALTATPAADGSPAATVTWTNPATDLAGNALDALTRVELYRDSELLLIDDNAAPGSEMTFADDVPAAGYYTYAVVAYVDDRAGERAEITSPWIGTDSPAAPTSVTLTAGDGRPTLTWNAPTAGEHGGYVDTAAQRFRVTRHPGDDIVANAIAATTFTDNDDLPLANYSYTVSTILDGLLSEGATSNTLVSGHALDLPYQANLRDTDDVALWSVLDANGDGKTWTWTDGKWGYTSFANADDYLYTPPFIATRGTHRLTFSAMGYNYRYSDAVEVLLTTGTDPATATTTVVYAIAQNEVYSAMLKEFTADFTVPATGTYHIAYHDISTDAWGLYIGATRIERTEAGPAGDLNGDGSVDVEDVNLLINVILERQDADALAGDADIDANGTVDITDVNELINTILR